MNLPATVDKSNGDMVNSTPTDGKIPLKVTFHFKV